MKSILGLGVIAIMFCQASFADPGFQTLNCAAFGANGAKLDQSNGTTQSDGAFYNQTFTVNGHQYSFHADAGSSNGSLQGLRLTVGIDGVTAQTNANIVGDIDLRMNGAETIMSCTLK
jgi:hypothetical protein